MVLFFSGDVSYRHITSRNKGWSKLVSISFFHMGETPKHNRTEESTEKQPPLRLGNQISCPITTRKPSCIGLCNRATKENSLLLDSHSWSSVVCFSAAKLAPRAWGHRSHSVLLDEESSAFPHTAHQQVNQNLEAHQQLQPHAFLLLFSAASPSCSIVFDHPHLHPPFPPSGSRSSALCCCPGL